MYRALLRKYRALLREYWWMRAVAEEEAVKCVKCGQTWAVREFSKGCPSCKPQANGKRGKKKGLRDPAAAVAQDNVERTDDQATAPPPMNVEELPELESGESIPNEFVHPVHIVRASTRDKDATKRHNEERDHSCRSTKVCKTKVPQAQVTRGLLMRSALPEELEARAEGEDIRDTVFTVPLLRDCIINMIHNMERDIELTRKERVVKVIGPEPP